MRRTLFYSSVAMLACGFLSHFQNISAQTTNQTVSITTEDKAKYQIPCTDKNLLSVWNVLKNELTNETTDDLNEIGVKNCADLFDVEKVIDLNGDKQPEIIVHQIGVNCPASGNCSFWIFQKKKSGYQSILDGDEIQFFALEKKKTNGYTDIRLGTQNSAASHYYQLFKFNGKKYTPRKCWWEDYMIPDKKGSFYEAKKPQIHYEKCGEYDYVN